MADQAAINGTWEGTNVNTTATSVVSATTTRPAFNSVWSVAMQTSELIRLYKQEFGDDWRQYFAATVKVETR